MGAASRELGLMTAVVVGWDSKRELVVFQILDNEYIRFWYYHEVGHTDGYTVNKEWFYEDMMAEILDPKTSVFLS